MASKGPSAVASATGVMQEPDGLGARAFSWMRMVVCGMHGHDSLLQFGRGRLYLKCVSCGHESPGCDIKSRATTPTAGQTHRFRRFLPQVAGARRVA